MFKAFDRFWSEFHTLIEDAKREIAEEFKDVPAGASKREETVTRETKDGVTIVTKTTKTWINKS